MGSSGDDYSTPPQQPAPPAGRITPFGQPSPDQGWQGINFLDNNTATGITPAMDAQIRAMSGPPPAPGGILQPGGGGPPGPPGGGGMMMTPDEREGLARLMVGAPPKAPPGVGMSNARYPGGGRQSFGQGNRGGWGGSTGGH